jgi:hypothetical protein
MKQRTNAEHLLTLVETSSTPLQPTATEIANALSVDLSELFFNAMKW